MRELLKNSSDFLFRKQNSVLSAAVVLMATYALSHILGLIKTRLLISYFFSTHPELLDVYNAAFVIPDTVFQLLVMGSLTAAFIPVFTRYLAKDESEAWHVASSSLNLIVLTFIGISILIFIFAHQLSQLIAPGFNSAQIATMASLLRVMLAAQLFFSISSFLTGIIQSHQRFLIPALAPLVYNLGIILGIVVLSPVLGIFGPAIGVVIGAFLHMLVQLPVAYRLGFRFTLRFNPGHPGVREITRLMPPRAAALGIDQIEHLISVTLASLLSAGSLSILNVSKLLYTIPSSLFGVAIGQAAFPTLSRQSLLTDKKQFATTLTDSLLQIIFLALPVSAIFIVLRIPIVRLIYGVPSFPWEATLLTGKTLAILSVSAGFYAAMQLIIRGFYALHDTRTPLKIGLFSAIFDALVGVVAVKFLGWGVPGIAVAISATAILETVILFWLLVKKLGALQDCIVRINKSIFKIVVATALTGLALWIPMRLLDVFVFDTTRTIALLGLSVLTSFIGITVYLLISYVLRVEELATYVSLTKRLVHVKKFLITSPTEEIITPSSDQS